MKITVYLLSSPSYLSPGGLVYSFGDLTWRQGLRIPPTYPLLESVLSGQCVVSVAAGSFHCGAVTREGAVYMWGENSSGQCGLSERGLVPDPSLVSMVDSEAVPPQVMYLFCLIFITKHQNYRKHFRHL